MIKNPLFWAGVLALLFLVFKREEVFQATPQPAVTPTELPATPQPSTVQVSPSVDMTEELNGVMAELPRKSDFAHLSDEELHHSPWKQRFGTTIGTLSERANSSPSRREPTLKFFLRCAENQEIISAARATCWWKLTNKLNEWKVFIPLSDAAVPLDIRRLAASMNTAQGT